MLYRVFNPDTGLYLRQGRQGWTKTGKTWTATGPFKNAAHQWWWNYWYQKDTPNTWRDWFCVPGRVAPANLEIHEMDPVTGYKIVHSFKRYMMEHVIEYLTKRNGYCAHKDLVVSLFTAELEHMGPVEDEEKPLLTGGKRTEDFVYLQFQESNIEKIREALNPYHVRLYHKLINGFSYGVEDQYEWRLITNAVSHRVIEEGDFIVIYPLDNSAEIVKKDHIKGRYFLGEKIDHLK